MLSAYGSWVMGIVNKVRPQAEKGELRFRVDLPEVLLVPKNIDARALGQYIAGGPMPPGCHGTTYAQFSAVGRLSDCDCGLIQCVCAQARRHQTDCRFRLALTCAVPIACSDHGLDVCSTCDPCSCGVPLDEDSETEVGGMVRGA